MRWNIVGAFIRNNPFGTEIAFRKGLERIGEHVTVIDPSYPNQVFDPNPDVTLVFKWVDPGPYRDTIKSLPGKKIVYQVDDLRFPHIKKMMQDMLDTCNHAFTFDQDGADLALDYGYRTAQRLLLTADDTLYRNILMQKDMDVCFVGSLSYGANHASRMKMVQIVQSMGLKFAVASELFDIGKVCEVYNRSKIVLNHATDVGQPFGKGFGYQCRHFEAGFTKSFVLSNEIVNEIASEDRLDGVETFGSEIELREKITHYLKNDYQREMMALRLYDCLLTKHKPEHRAREMIEFVKAIK